MSMMRLRPEGATRNPEHIVSRQSFRRYGSRGQGWSAVGQRGRPAHDARMATMGWSLHGQCRGLALTGEPHENGSGNRSMRSIEPVHSYAETQVAKYNASNITASEQFGARFVPTPETRTRNRS